MNRALAVTRMHLVNRRAMVAVPVGVLALAVAINLTIWAFLPRNGRTTGSASSIYVVVFALALTGVVRGFPFALGMGASRKAFGRGTALTGCLLAVVFGTGVWLLGLVERGTGGWGMGGHFFYYTWMGQSDVLVWWVLVTMPFLTCFFIGSLVASVFLRWGMPGIVGAGFLAILVSGVAAILVTSQHAWTSGGSWFADRSPLGATGWLALLTVAVGLLGWGALRRTAL